MKQTIVMCEMCGINYVSVEYEEYFPSHYIYCTECDKKPKARHTCQDEAEEWLRARGLFEETEEK